MATKKSSGYKRVYLGAGTAILTIVAFFLVLESAGLQITCDGDKACPGTKANPCISYCKIVNPTSKSIYIYNKEGIKLDFTPGIKSYEMFVKYYNKWRFTNFTKETRLPNIPDDRIYVFVFPAYSTKEFKIVGYKNNPLDKIKWGFGADKAYLDPYWLPVGQLTSNITVLDKNFNDTAFFEMTWLNSSSGCGLVNSSSPIITEENVITFNNTESSFNITFASDNYDVGILVPEGLLPKSITMNLTSEQEGGHYIIEATNYDDTWAREENPSSTEGCGWPGLPTRNYTGKVTHTFIKFNLTDPVNLTGKVVDDASLNIYKITYTTSENIKLYRINSSWYCPTLTWNTQPTVDEPEIGTFYASGAFTWQDWSNDALISDVNSFLNGTLSNYGWRITRINFIDNQNIIFEAVEHGDDHPAYLELEIDGASNISIDVGNNGVVDYQGSGYVSGTQAIDVGIGSMADYIANNCTYVGGYCNVPLKISSDTAGNLTLSNLLVEFDKNQRSFNNSRDEYNITFASSNTEVGIRLPKDIVEIPGIVSATLNITLDSVNEDPVNITDNSSINADTYVSRFDSGANYGGNTLMVLRNWTSGGFNYPSHLLTNFSLENYADYTNITNAYILLYKYNHGGTATIDVCSYRVTSSWAEMSVTYNTRPSFDSTCLGPISKPVTDGSPWIFDVTDSFMSMVNGTYTNYGWYQQVVSAETFADYVQFYTRESGSYPSLVVTQQATSSDFTIDTGIDGTDDWFGTLSVGEEAEVDLNISAIYSYMKDCSEDGQGYCTVPFNITSSLKTNVTLNNLFIEREIKQQFFNNSDTSMEIDLQSTNNEVGIDLPKNYTFTKSDVNLTGSRFAEYTDTFNLGSAGAYNSYMWQYGNYMLHGRHTGNLLVINATSRALVTTLTQGTGDSYAKIFADEQGVYASRTNSVVWYNWDWSTNTTFSVAGTNRAVCASDDYVFIGNGGTIKAYNKTNSSDIVATLSIVTDYSCDTSENFVCVAGCGGSTSWYVRCFYLANLTLFQTYVTPTSCTTDLKMSEEDNIIVFAGTNSATCRVFYLLNASLLSSPGNSCNNQIKQFWIDEEHDRIACGRGATGYTQYVNYDATDYVTIYYSGTQSRAVAYNPIRDEWWNSPGSTASIYVHEIGTPTNVSIDTGADGDVDWYYSGELTGPVTADLDINEIEDYVGACGDDPCTVPIAISSDTVGTLVLDALDVEYSSIKYGRWWFEHNFTGTPTNTTKTNFFNETQETVNWTSIVPTTYGYLTVKGWAEDTCDVTNSSNEIVIYSANTEPTVTYAYPYAYYEACVIGNNSYVEPFGQNSTVGFTLVNNSQTWAANVTIYNYLDHSEPSGAQYFVANNSDWNNSVILNTSSQAVCWLEPDESCYIWNWFNCTDAQPSNGTLFTNFTNISIWSLESGMNLTSVASSESINGGHFANHTDNETRWSYICSDADQSPWFNATDMTDADGFGLRSNSTWDTFLIFRSNGWTDYYRCPSAGGWSGTGWHSDTIAVGDCGETGSPDWSYIDDICIGHWQNVSEMNASVWYDEFVVFWQLGGVANNTIWWDFGVEGGVE